MLRCLVAVAYSLCAGCAFAQSFPADKTAAIVCKSESEEVLLHENATTALPVLDIVPCGARVTIVARQLSWYRVRMQDGKEGYVKDAFVAEDSILDRRTMGAKDGYIVCPSTIDDVSLMKSPGELGMITKVACGEKVAVLEEGLGHEGDWDNVRTNGGEVGFIWRGFISWKPMKGKPLRAPTGQEETKSNVPSRAAWVKCFLGWKTVSLWPQPGGLGKAFVEIPCGDQVQLLEEGEWEKVRASGNQVGWVNRFYISLTPWAPELETDSNVSKVSALSAPPQQSTVYEARQEEINYAVEAINKIRNGLIDPTSFTLLQLTTSEKWDKHGTVTYQGCIHFVGSAPCYNIYSNTCGMKMQQFASYSVDKKGRMMAGLSGGLLFAFDYCYSNPASRVDLTDEVRRALANP